MKRAQFCLLSQIVDRLQVDLGHPVTGFSQLRNYVENQDTINPTLSPRPSVAKGIAIGVLNGRHIPNHLTDNDFVVGLKRESRLLRWIAATLDPTFHTFLLQEGEKDWPEATLLFYLWTPAEDWVLEEMFKFAEQYRPYRLSLHFDAIKIDNSRMGGDLPGIPLFDLEYSRQATNYALPYSIGVSAIVYNRNFQELDDKVYYTFLVLTASPEPYPTRI